MLHIMLYCMMNCIYGLNSNGVTEFNYSDNDTLHQNKCKLFIECSGICDQWKITTILLFGPVGTCILALFMYDINKSGFWILYNSMSVYLPTGCAAYLRSLLCHFELSWLYYLILHNNNCRIPKVFFLYKCEVYTWCGQSTVTSYI